MPSITSANSTLALGVTGLFDTAVAIQGFGVDEGYEFETVDSAEAQIGVDGVLSVGYIPQIVTMNVTLQADSPSNDFFEEWYKANKSGRANFVAFGVVAQPSISRVYHLTQGYLRNYTPAASAKKVLGARKFQIVWADVDGAPV